MTEDREKTQLILLRILGVLLIAVGITLVARQVRSETSFPVRIAQSIVSGELFERPHCERRVVQIRKVGFAPVAPVPPAPPAPPVPPLPPTPIFVF